MTEKSQNLYLSLGFWLTSAIFSYSLVPFDSPPFFSFALIVVFLSNFILFFKGSKTRYDYIWFIFSLVFPTFLILRSNEFITFINFCASILTTSLLAVSSTHINSLSKLFLSPITLIRDLVTTRNKYHMTGPIKEKADGGTLNFLSISLSLVLGLIIISLLSSANPFFDKLIENTFGKILNESLGIHLGRLVLFFVFAFFIPKLASFLGTNNPQLEVKKTDTGSFMTLLLPKVITIIILAVFFVTQVQLYFASNEVLATLGYTHSQYAREVFGQLIVVSFIIGGLVYFDRSHSRSNRLTTTLLLIEGVFLSFMALKSVNDYVSVWGLTEKRLWGYTVAMWMLGTYGFFIFTHFKKLAHEALIKEIVAWSGLIGILVNIFNFDFLIYNYSKASTHLGVDYLYLSKLSADAHSYKDNLDKSMNILKSPNPNTFDPTYRTQTRLAVGNTLSRIDGLKRKYDKPNWRVFNLSEYLEYKSIKDINTTSYREELNKLDSDNVTRG